MSEYFRRSSEREGNPDNVPKHSPTLQELRPGGISVDGFLKQDQTLEQVLERDKKALEMLDYTAQEVADLLAPIIETSANRRNFEYSAPNGKKYEVRVQVYRGTQKCPWGDKVDWRKSSGAIDIYLTEKGKGSESVHITGLARHLAEGHGFFEGGSYRMAPEKIIEMFGVEKIPGSIAEVRKLEF